MAEASPVRVSLLPRPRLLAPRPGAFRLLPATPLAVARDDAEARSCAHAVARQIESACGWSPPFAGAGTPGAIAVESDVAGGLPPEGYRLDVEPGGARLRAPSGAGLFYAAQTFSQLLPVARPGAAEVELPCLLIEDAPRFPWRGLHLDVSRHVFPVAFVKKYVDALAMHKLNVFHWHLTDDQGWRLQIRAYPRLTEVGAWRRASSLLRVPGDGRYGGFYTQDEVRDVVAYAAERHVCVVPEIEMPGHAQAAIAAYPQLGTDPGEVEVGNRMGGSPHIFNVEESTFAFLEDVLDEVLEIFPGPWVHVGGDEADTSRWRSSRRVAERMRELGAADAEALHAYFIGRIAAFLQRRGRRLVGWDEILTGGAPRGAVIMAWRGTAGGIAAARAGHDVVMSPDTHCYLDHYQGDPAIEAPALGPPVRLRRVFDFEPLAAELSPAEAAHVLGGQGNLWTEFIETTAHVETMAYPRACALAEVLWSPRAGRDWGDFVRRLAAHLPRLERAGIACSASAYQVSFACEPSVESDVFRVSLSNELGEQEIRYTTDGGEPDAASPLYRGPLTLRAPVVLRAAVFAGGARRGPVSPLRLAGCWRDRIEAARFDRAERAICVAAALDQGAERDLVVGFAGSHIVFERADLGEVATLRLEVGLAPGHTRGGRVEARLGGPRGELLASVAVPESAPAFGFVELAASLRSRAGVHALCICFVNDELAESELVALLATLRLCR